MHRYILIGLILAGGVISARAQEYPFCLEPNAFSVGTCSYDTYAQCMASASGNMGICVRNPRYVAPPPQPVQQMPAPMPPAKQSKGSKKQP